eukprot:GFUD01137579.1.p1 GENE.GFUD01137579.1~~GFUD01137579.1.p1  ORF type:complete len:145 (-),score=30.45 GFUD01137579.1:368-802(-)
MEKGKSNDSMMLNYSARLATYTSWPFTENCSCTPERMAAAGFYCCGGENDPDSVRCYFCRKELDGWEPEDDPWKEHVSHAKGKCAYVRLGKKPEELTVADVFGLLEGDKHKTILGKSSDVWEEKFAVEAEAAKRDIDNLVAKAS